MSQFAFRYKALDLRGLPTRGQIQAASRQDAFRQIVATGMRPLQIHHQRSSLGDRAKKITLKDLAYLTYQLSVLTESKIPIVDGLRAIAEQENNPALRQVLVDITERIEAGQSITEALEPHRKLFGEVYIQTMRAAERSNNMMEILSRLAAMLDRQYEAAKNVKGALMYPLCVLVALTLAVTFLVIFVVPSTAEMFASRGVALPLPTQLVIGVSHVIRGYWYAFIAVGIGGYWLAHRAWENPAARQRIDHWLHRIPFIRDVLQGYALSRFASVLGISLRSGLNLVEALDMSGKASARPLLETEAQYLRDQVNSGARLSDLMSSCEYLPPLPRRMFAAGEEAGELPKMCQIVANHYDREVNHLAKNVATVIEPILILGLAGIVLVIALAIFLPMWNMGALLS